MILAVMVVRKGNTKAVNIDTGAAVGAAGHNVLVRGFGQFFKIGVVHMTDYVIGAV